MNAFAVVTAGELEALVGSASQPFYMDVGGERVRLVRAERGAFDDGYVYLTFGGGASEFMDEAQVVSLYQ